LESADCGLKNKEKLAETIDQPTRSMGNTLYTIYGQIKFEKDFWQEVKAYKNRALLVLKK
jgi:hypothetical protein